jgi:RnfABCDGE-type electron transport complex B subunit
MQIIIATLVISLVLAVVLGFLLGIFKKLFSMDVDPTVERVRSVLPGANCGACGYPGCDGLAEAIASGSAPVNACPVGGEAVSSAVGQIMGVEASSVRQVAVLLCQGTRDVCQDKAVYNGVKTCLAAKISVNGTRNCDFGCMGFGDCVKVCPFDAIHVGADGLVSVDSGKCTGCGLCVAECSQKILTLAPVSRTGALALCSNRNPKKAQVIKDCKTGCIKCMKCEKVCPKQCIKVVNGIPLVDYALCDSCGLCVENCPTKVLALVENKVVTV